MLLLFDYKTLRIFLDGMLCMMLVYTLISYFWHHKQTYSLYSLYLFCIFWYLYLNDQYHLDIDQHASVRQIQFGMLTESIVQCFSFIIYGRFAVLLMDLQTNDKTSVKLINAISILSLLLIIVDVISYITGTTGNAIQGNFHSFSRYVLAALALATVPRILRLKNQILSFFITGTSFYLIGAILGLVMFQTGWATRQPEKPFTFPMTPLEIGVILESVCVMIGISLLNRRSEREKIRIQAQLIEQLQENERKQTRLNNLRDEIALDLHDEIGSQLSSISILSQTTSRYVVDAKVQDRLQTISQTARQVMDSMREIVWSLNSSSNSLQHIGLRIQETAYSLFADSTIQLYTECDQSDELTGLTQKQRRELYLIAKECLTNILRHAQATRVWIQLQTTPDGLLLCLKDDGKGFSIASKTSGIGLQSVRQRAHQLGALLTINTADGQGTTVLITLQSHQLTNPNPIISHRQIADNEVR